jgi:hypothetical protein
MTENQIHPDDIAAYIQDNGLLKNNIDLANMVNFFAELIVQECISTISINNTNEQLFTNVGYNNGYCDSRGDASFILKQHFGVEE